MSGEWLWRVDTKTWAQEVQAVGGPVYIFGDPSENRASGVKAGITSYKALPRG